MSKPTTVRLADETVLELERIARRRGTTVSAIIQEVVQQSYLKENRTGAVDSHLKYIHANPHPVEDTVEEIESRIRAGLRDAAR